MSESVTLCRTSVPSPFNDLLRIERHMWSDAETQMSIEIDETHRSSNGLCNGGVIASLLNSTCNASGSYPVDGELRYSVALTFTINFHHGVRSGRLTSRATHRRVSRDIFHAGGEISDESGRVIASGLGTYKLINGDRSQVAAP